MIKRNGVYYILVILGLAYERLIEKGHAAPALRLPAFEDTRLRTIVLCSASLVVLFLLRLALIYDAAHDPSFLGHVIRAPLAHVYDHPDAWPQAHRMSISLCLAGISAASSLALFILHRSLTARGPRRIDGIAVGIACILMASAALLAPAFSSSDPYLYAIYAELGLHAYAPHAVSIPCPDPRPQAWCAQRVVPALYGPLFLVYLHALLGHTHSIWTRIGILRVSNAAWAALLLFSLARAGARLPVLALAALNPVLWGEYVSDAHNDIIGVALIMLGISFGERLPLLKLLLSSAASLVKAPFIFLGLLTFFRLPPRPRWAWASATLACSIAALLLWGGRPYIESLLTTGRSPRFFTDAPARSGDVLLALVLIAFTLARREIKLSGAYAIPVLGDASAHSWYTWSALPYIVWSDSKLVVFLTALPMTAFLVETPFQLPRLMTALTCAMIALVLVTLVRKPLAAP